jgi:hypothetical protein
MTDSSFCGYDGDRENALIACLYEDGADTSERVLFEAHLAVCARCRDELATLRGVRSQLARWAPPEPTFAVLHGTEPSAIRPSRASGRPEPVEGRNPQSAMAPAPWWRQIPAWAQVAAALLFLGASAAIANLDVRYDANGLQVRTGWMQASASAPIDGAPAASASRVASSSTDAATPWRADLAALEQQLRAELRSARMAAAQAPVAPRAVASTPDADLVRRVRALVDESEKRQQRELALRVAEVMRDVATQRQADLVKIDRTLGVVQNNLGVEVMRDRQRLDILYRASQRQ